jgi:hypothetical protein
MRAQDYIAMIDSYLNNEVTAENFAVVFQRTFQSDNTFVIHEWEY